MKFYKPLGEEINKEQFIKMYSDAYYTGKVDGDRIPGLNKNSKYIEEEIEKLLNNGFDNEIDLIRIIAWKMGKIRLSLSEEKREFCYCKDWAIDEKSGYFKITRYGKDFSVQPMIDYIVENKEELFETNNPQIILNNLRDNSTNGIGTVYLITLLYFISKANYPIYDKFAWLALKAIMNNENPTITKGFKYKELPIKDSVGFDCLCENEYADYILDIKSVFGDEYKTNRDIDRALWVYGHQFKYDKYNC